MRNFLLFICAIISIALGAFSYLALSGQITSTLYILITLGISILLTFSCGHGFSGLYSANKELKKLSGTNFTKEKVQEDEINRLNAKIEDLTQQLQNTQSNN